MNSERGEFWAKLVARISAVEMEKDFGDASINRLKEVATKNMMGAYHSLAIDIAEGMIFLMRSSKEGYYKTSSDEAIAKVIMEAANEQKPKKR